VDTPKLSATISMSRKINLGNYESADVFISLGGIYEETTVEDVVALLEGPVKDTFDILKVRLAEQVRRAREEGGK
jgi:hypothetical protein